MAETETDRADRWSDRVDQLCVDGETVEAEFDLGTATVAVTTRRVLVLTPGASGRNFRDVDRPNVGTVTVETAQQPRQLCWAIVAAAVGIGLIEAARAVDFAGFAPAVGLGPAGSLPGVSEIAHVVDGALSAIETALLVLDWAVLAGGVAAFVLAVAFVGRYVRSRSRRLVLRVNGGDDVALPVDGVDYGADLAADLEAAIRPGPTLGGESGAPGGTTQRPGNERSDGERARSDRPSGEWFGDEESG